MQFNTLNDLNVYLNVAFFSGDYHDLYVEWLIDLISSANVVKIHII